MNEIVSLVKGAFSNLDAGDDFVDQLHRHITTGLLTLFGVATSIYLYFGSPLQCFVPPQYTGAWEQYAEEYCFVEHTYFVPEHKAIPKNLGDRQPKIFYYQWVPFFLGLQAILFYLPYGLWTAFSSRTGIEVSTVLEMAKTSRIYWYNYHQDPENKKGKETAAQVLADARAGKPLKKHETTWFNDSWVIQTLAAIISSRSAFAADRRNTGRHGLATASLTFLAPLYLVIKLLYLINVLVQLVLVNLMLGASLARYPLFGFFMLADLLNNREWWLTGLFPRIVYCDLDIRVLANTQHNTYQCLLQVNMYYEKIYLFLWFWMFALTIATVISFVKWMWMLLPAQRNAYVHRLLRDARLNRYAIGRDPHPVHKDYASFVGDTYLGMDGVFLLYLIERNSGRIISANVANEIYEGCKKNADGSELPPADRDARQYEAPPYEALVDPKARASARDDGVGYADDDAAAVPKS